MFLARTFLNGKHRSVSQAEQRGVEEMRLNDANSSNGRFVNPDRRRAYTRYDLDVAEGQADKASGFKLGSFQRPHMRAFHYSWFGFFVAFFIWFAILPILPYMTSELRLSSEELWTSSIIGLSSTTLVRLAAGPICDVYGPRLPFAVMLCMASVPAAMTGLVGNAAGLFLLRFFIGIAGGTFVTCQYWASRMFAKEVVGTANGLVGGWGNLGSGTQPRFDELTVN
jgi:MFS transporter, NNP family, nitrate/nitrite transporter